MLLRLALSTAARPSAGALLVGKSSQAFLQQSKPSLNSLRQYARQPVRSTRAPVEQVRTGPTLKERLMAPPSANGESTLHHPSPATESFFLFQPIPWAKVPLLELLSLAWVHSATMESVWASTRALQTTPCKIHAVDFAYLPRFLCLLYISGLVCGRNL